MYRYILFDFDGTVFDTLEGITKSLQLALKRKSMEVSLESLRCFAGPPLLEKLMEVYNFSEDEAREVIAWFRERYVPIGLYESRIFPGIDGLLTALKNDGRKLGITTLKPQYAAEELLKQSGIIDKFDAVFGTLKDGAGETKQQKIRLAMEAMGAKREETILVGDTKYDIRGAKEADVSSLGVRYGYGAPGELEAVGADYIVDTVEELRSWLLNH
ncbi:MAG: HAD hydrolase-like protein [Candidatus Limivicinus sp.]|jgi:phosphoglycolate phosphatase